MYHNSTLLPVPPSPSLSLAVPPQEKKTSKQSNKQTRTRTKQPKKQTTTTTKVSLLLLVSLLSNNPSFILVTVEASVSHTAYPFVLSALPANGHCNEYGSRPLVSATPSTLDPHQNSSEISCGCPKSRRA